MALVIKTLAQREAERVAAGMKADRRLYLSADKQCVVEEGDPDAAFLFAGVGGEILPDDANRYGLSIADGKVVVAAKAVESVAEAKAKEAPKAKERKKPADKAVRGPEGDK